MSGNSSGSAATHLPMMLPACEWHTSIRVRMPCGWPGAAGIGSSPSITRRCTSNRPSCAAAGTCKLITREV